MKLFCYNTDDYGCYWYRLLTPFSKIKEKCLNNSFDFSFRVDSVEQIKDFDIVVLQRATDGLGVDFLIEAKKHNIPVIYEVDDSLFNIADTNPAYKHYTRKDVRYAINYTVNNSDYMTVSTPYLSEYYKKEVGKQEIVILPNSIPLSKEYDRTNLVQKKSGKFRILLTGGISHTGDWSFMANTFRDLVHNSKGEIEIMIFGFVPKALEGLPNTFYVKAVPVEKYMETLAKLNFDLMLAPLADIDFNTYKSNLKFIESAVMGVPMIGSDVIAYNSTIIDGHNGWLLPNNPYRWMKHIERIRKDKELLKTVAANAYKTVEDGFDLDKTYKLWANLYNKAVSEKGGKNLIELE